MELEWKIGNQGFCNFSNNLSYTGYHCGSSINFNPDFAHQTLNFF